MELIPVNRYTNIALVIWVLIFALLFLRHFKRLLNLEKIFKKNNASEFFQTVDAYLQKYKRLNIRNQYIFYKIDGMIKFNDWSGLEALIGAYKPYFSSGLVKRCCNTILNLFLSDKMKEAKILLSKMENPPKKV